MGILLAIDFGRLWEAINYVYDTLFIIKIGINGVASIDRYGINQNLKDFFNVDNTFNETVNHFLQSFRAKKTPKI